MNKRDAKLFDAFSQYDVAVMQEIQILSKSKEGYAITKIEM